MATYTIHWYSTGGTSIEVEADSLDEAIDLAGEDLPGSLCHQCADHADGFGDSWELAGATNPDGSYTDLDPARTDA